MSLEAIRAVTFYDGLEVRTCPRPAPTADEALIRLRLGGICNTDLELMQGYKGFAGTLGHEFVGQVVEGPAEWVDRRVVGEINVSCGACDLCRRGMPTHCRRRRVLGLIDYCGAFADLFCLPVRNLWAVPDSVPDEAAVFTEPLAAACQILDSAHIRPGDRVILIGAGKLGLLGAQVVRLSGADLVVIARCERPATLLHQWGIRTAERAALENGQADVVIDCTGSADGFAAALDLVRPRGTIVLKSTYAGLPQADLTRIAVNELRVVGSRCGPFGAALRLLESELVDVRSLIEARYPLAEAGQALEYAARPGVLKVLLEP
ncbi:MAG: alcohol dehydrogenase catalytic domain-containing protein [Chloroflexi bacterium]|nr:alcohol dehydrogenase catalytic domain-containing protein [Chloroflexota bacterium]